MPNSILVFLLCDDHRSFLKPALILNRLALPRLQTAFTKVFHLSASTRHAANKQFAKMNAVRDTALVVMTPMMEIIVYSSPGLVGKHLVVTTDVAFIQHVLAEISVLVMIPASRRDSKPASMDAVP